MKNWSGLLTWNPDKILKPTQKEEIIAIVHKALDENKKIRVIGSGHSFTPLCVTNDVLISLENYQGILSVDNSSKKVSVKSGTNLHILNRLLDLQGLALENLGDIDVQSIAGAISTGTHGTGIEFGNLSTQISQIEFINGKGELIVCSEYGNMDVFKAAQVSLGSLGILTEITLKCVDSYVLELKVSKESIDDVFYNLDQINKNNRHFEFYWFPNTKWTMTKKLKAVNRAPKNNPIKDYLQETVFENHAFKIICELAHRMPSWTNRLSSISASTLSSYQSTKKSFEIFSTKRLVKFNEMEYNVPIEAYIEVKKDIMKWMDRNNKDVLFPLENRFVKKDDIYLSPAYNRESAYIAAHVYHKANHTSYFNGLEQIFKAYGGRPHWGKIHTLTKYDLATLYPQYNTFNRIRMHHDPQNIFLSPYLSSLFQ